MSIWRAVVTISHAVLGGTGTNTWHVRTEGDPLEPIAVDDIMAVIHGFYTARASNFASGAVIRWNGVLDGVGPSAGTAYDRDPWTVTGGGSGKILPPANCICVTWEGQSGDRSKVGRTFLGPLSQNTLAEDGTLDDGVLTEFRTAAADLIDASEAFANGAIGVWSRQESVFRDFVASHVSDKFAVLRSRRD